MVFQNAHSTLTISYKANEENDISATSKAIYPFDHEYLTRKPHYDQLNEELVHRP